jgi:NADH:ubiquinone oxidoreductase subunit H
MFTAILFCTVLVILFLVSILYAVRAEQRLPAEIQGREGPSILGFLGVLQTPVDGIKVFFKILFFVLPSILLA